jgi:hypothetical protein
MKDALLLLAHASSLGGETPAEVSGDSPAERAELGNLRLTKSLPRDLSAPYGGVSINLPGTTCNR